MQHSQIINDLQEFIDKRSLNKDISCTLHASDLAEALEELRAQNKEAFEYYIKNMPREILADVLIELPDNYQEEIISQTSPKDLSDIVNELDTDDATDLIQAIEEQDSQKAQDVLKGLEEEHKEDIESLIRYKEDTAGSIMQVELLSAFIDETIASAIARLKELKAKDEVENIHYIFITDRSFKLLYVISLEDLILIDFDHTFEDIKDKLEKPISVFSNESVEEVTFLVEKYDLPVLPVVNEKKQLIGRITSDDIYDLIQESATEQIYSLANLDADEELHDSAFKISKKRIFWLGINLITAVLAANVIGVFEATIEKMVALAVLMPIVASMGGVAGTQTLTVVVRQIALGEIDKTNGKIILKKELGVGLINGLVFSLVGTIIAWWWFNMPVLGLIMAVALFVNMFFAALFGAVIPMALKHFSIDPAVSSGVILTTVTDVIGFFVFLGLAAIV